MSILYDEQKIISDNIYSGLKKQELYNIPTGRGKTFILLDVAMRCFREDGKKVIVSVSNNYLVREMHQTAKKYFDTNEDKSIVSIEIGRDNYLSTDKLIWQSANGGLKAYCTPESIESFLHKHSETIKNEDTMFFDVFDEEIEYIDIANEFIVHEMLKSESREAKEEGGVIITNHYYLLSKSMYVKDFDLSQYVILIDEVHEIADVFMQISTNSFSFFDYKNKLSVIEKEVAQRKDFVGKISLIDSLKKQRIRATKDLKSHISPSLVGKYVSLNEEVFPVKKDLISLLSKKEHSLIEKHIKKQQIDELKYFDKIKDIYNTVKMSDSSSSRVSLGLYYSPSLGYPTITISSTNPLGRINSLFWSKINDFAGVSGSVTCSFEPNDKEIKYGYSRLGFLKKDDKRKINFYERTFPRENIAIQFIERSFYDGVKKETVYDKDFNPDCSPYYKKIISYIHNNRNNKNSMVLCSGYKEAKYLFSLYSLMFDEEGLHCSIPTEKPMTTLARFKKEGGVLFATKNYGTGTSLEGELLVNLFIIKMPYPDYTLKYWQELKKRSEGLFRQTFEREMMITLMQILGRVARTDKDCGKIFIADYNFSTKPKNKRAITKIIETYGIIEKLEKKLFQKTISKKEMEELF